MRESTPGETMKVIRIVLLIANGGLLLIMVAGLLLVARSRNFIQAIPIAVWSFILAGNVAYIWRCPHGHKRRVRSPVIRQILDNRPGCGRVAGVLPMSAVEEPATTPFRESLAMGGLRRTLI